MCTTALFEDSTALQVHLQHLSKFQYLAPPVADSSCRSSEICSVGTHPSGSPISQFSAFLALARSCIKLLGVVNSTMIAEEFPSTMNYVAIVKRIIEILQIRIDTILLKQVIPMT